MNHFEFYFYSVSLYDNYVVCDSHDRGESTLNRAKHIKLRNGIAQKPFGATSWDIKRHGNSLLIVSISIKCEKFYKITRYCCFNDSFPHDSTPERSTNIVGTPMKFARVSSSDIWFAKILRQHCYETTSRNHVWIRFSVFLCRRSLSQLPHRRHVNIFVAVEARSQTSSETISEILSIGRE